MYEVTQNLKASDVNGLMVAKINISMLPLLTANSYLISKYIFHLSSIQIILGAEAIILARADEQKQRAYLTEKSSEHERRGLGGRGAVPLAGILHDLTNKIP